MSNRIKQLKARQAILRGETPEKRIFVSMDDLDFKKKAKEEAKKEQQRINEKLEVTKEARMPWFCPSCDKVMKKQLDNRMWYLYGHCFNCQVTVENKMRIDGTYDDWAEKKIIANKLAWIKEQKQSIEEFKKQDKVEFLEQIRPDGYSVDKEKWNMNHEKIKEQADEALEYLQKIEDSLL
jgi:hypothetical protein